MHSICSSSAVICVVLSVVFTIVTTLTALPRCCSSSHPGRAVPGRGGPPPSTSSSSAFRPRCCSTTPPPSCNLGDSNTHSISCCLPVFLNIGLDPAVHRTAGYGRGEAAIATVVSQLFMTCCTWWFFTRVEGIPFHPGKLCPSAEGHCGRQAISAFRWALSIPFLLPSVPSSCRMPSNLLGSTAVAAQTHDEG